MKNLFLILVVVLMSVGCGNKSTSFSTLPKGESFKQNSSILSNQLDILWVVDNSGSMSPLQTNLVSNFNSFISNFQTKGYDFKMSVTTSDAYLADATLSGYVASNAPLAKFRDGLGATHTGIFTILPTTPNLSNVFVTNATQGASGAGDERVFSSFRTALNSPSNAGFLRPQSFFAVIILSDEDDFSGNGRCELCAVDHNYAAGTLDPVNSYVSYLDTLTQTTGASRRYNVSAITVLDSTCQASHSAQAPSTIIGQRYIQLAQATSGVTGSICDVSFATALSQIQNQISELSTQFVLGQVPIVSTIVVTVNGNLVPNDGTSGWTFNGAANSIVFHGSAIPPQNAIINVNFTPASLTAH